MADASVSPIDLAHEPDFSVGPLLVRPSLRAAVHEGVEQQLEPRVMQVLVVLARRANEVVSRDDLVTLCWGGRAIGEDAIQRPVAQLRKLAEETGAFSIETIARVGYRLTAKGGISQLTAPNEPGEAAKPARLSKRAVIAAAALGVLVLAGAGWGAASFLGRGPALAPSIAVLPFDNVSGDPGKDYLARGVAMEVIDTLAQLKGMEVISRNSSFSFPAKADPLDVGAKLNVAHVLSGTVRQAGGRIAVTAELVDARTRRTIRTDTYEIDLAATGMGGWQTRVAQNISGAMSIAFYVNARRRLDGTGTRSLEAYDLYLRGFDEWWFKGNQLASIDYYTQATAIDPNYAEAWGGMAIAIASTGFNYADPADARAQQDKAFGYARRAVELAPDLNMSQGMFAAVATTQHKWIEGDEAFQKSLAISRTEMTLVNWWFLLQRTGRLAESARVMEEIERVDPIRGINFLVVHGYAAQGRYDDLKKEVARRGWSGSSELTPLINLLDYQINTTGSREDIRAVLVGLSRRTEQAPAELASRMLSSFDDTAKARAALRAAYDDPKLAHSSRWEMVPYLAAWLGDDDLVLRVWRDELPVNMLRTLYIWDPAFARARKLPGFKLLVRELGMVDYWRTKGWADKCRPVGADDFECT